MGQKLLREYYELCDGGVCQDLLTEDEKRYVANGGMMLSGKLQEADVQNGNGRVYPRNVLVREIKNYKKLVKENRALGELDHPDDSDSMSKDQGLWLAQPGSPRYIQAVPPTSGSQFPEPQIPTQRIQAKGPKPKIQSQSSQAKATERFFLKPSSQAQVPHKKVPNLQFLSQCS